MNILQRFWGAHREFLKFCGIIYGLSYVLILVCGMLSLPSAAWFTLAWFLAAILGLAASMSLFGYFLGCIPPRKS